VPRRAAALAAVLVLALAVLSAQKKTTPQRKSAQKKAAPAPTKAAEAAVPFRAGETLQYAAQWNKFVTAANIRVAVMERRDFYGHAAWHFQAVAHTIDPVRLIYALDDQFDSYTDAVTLSSLQYESYIHEQARNLDLIVPMTSDPQAARSNTHVYLVLPGTRDPLGLLYDLRAQDWKREPSVRMPVFDGRRYYMVLAQAEAASGEATIAAGAFPVTRIALRITENGHELPNVKFWVSLAKNTDRTPLLMEAELPFGTIRVELLGAPAK
jgi:hypothetical protein